MGCSPEIAEQYRKPPAVDFEVEPSGWETLRMFMRLQTQWNMQVSMGGVVCTGLNYQSIEFLFRIGKIERQDEVMDDLHAMELAALEIINQSSRQDGA